MVSIIRLIYFIPQTATWTTSSTPIPETSHLVRFGFRHENFEKRLKTLIISSIDSTFLTKKEVSSAYTEYKKI